MKNRQLYRASWRDKIQHVSDAVSETLITAITSPYYLLFERNTKSPILAIAAARNEEEVKNRVQTWLNTKQKEAQYVQIAGAVIFASAISSLSWTDLAGRHWSGPACWYTTIVLAITAVLSGAQQTILLDSSSATNNMIAHRSLCRGSKTPNWIVVFAWQCPLMFLSYAVLFYLGGVMSYVASPVVSNPVWDGNAKTLVFYAITTFCTLITFMVSSRLVHSTLPEDKSQVEKKETPTTQSKPISTINRFSLSLPFHERLCEEDGEGLRG